jgi:hypothetical protein
MCAIIVQRILAKQISEGANKAATVFHKEPIEKLVEKITYGPCDH